MNVFQEVPPKFCRHSLSLPPSHMPSTSQLHKFHSPNNT
jgi:hypothetical protein